MRHIEHDNPVPPSLVAEATSHSRPGFSPANAWGSFEGKKEIRDRLWSIQRGLCAYCESRPGNKGFHIEHIRRKSLHPKETFNWQNLVLNCQNDKSCGHFKDRDKNRQPAVADDLRFIKPTDAGCHRYFRYSKYGDIVPSRKLENEADHQKAKFTIEVLGLQCYRLVRDRKSILTKFYKIYESVKKQKVALDSYLADEFPDCGDDFAFWSARNQHRKLLEQAPEEE